MTIRGELASRNTGKGYWERKEGETVLEAVVKEWGCEDREEGSRVVGGVDAKVPGKGPKPKRVDQSCAR